MMKPLDKWNISDTAADYIFTGHHLLNFALPGTLKVIVYPATWMQAGIKRNIFRSMTSGHLQKQN
jgi:(E)-4-hydroxy-3-methylbut-2-enyl-diphosphate synthase